MDKGKLTALVRLKTGWDKEASEKSVDLVLHCLRELLLNHGDRLTIHGFGTFAVKMSRPRRARNIRTGETVVVPPRKQVKFRMSSEFLT